jgi:hypothetical protein
VFKIDTPLNVANFQFIFVIDYSVIESLR